MSCTARRRGGIGHALYLASHWQGELSAVQNALMDDLLCREMRMRRAGYSSTESSAQQTDPLVPVSPEWITDRLPYPHPAKPRPGAGVMNYG